MAKVDESGGQRLIDNESVGSSSIDNWNQDQAAQKAKGKTVYKYDSLTDVQVWAYGVGHFVNDLTAALWFNYLLYYLREVVRIDYGPTSFIAGQFADAIATPLVGYFSDRTDTKIGKRMPWYIGGYVVLLVTFLPVYNGCLMCEYVSDTTIVEAFYYIFFPMVFNFGWASLQISHMSLVPSLSCGRSRRDRLNSLRNTFSFIAILFVYCTALLMFQTIADPTLQFSYLSFIAMGAGTMTSLFFIMQINEPVLTKECFQIAKTLQKTLTSSPQRKIRNVKKNSAKSPDGKLNASENSAMESVVSKDGNESDPDIENYQYTVKNQGVAKVSVNKGSLADEIVNWKQWFTEVAFYRYGLVYMGVRLYCNVSSTLITFYLITVLGFKNNEGENQTPIQIALIPLSLYLMSVLSSSVLDRLYGWLGKKITLTIGVLLCGGTSFALAILTPEYRSYVYGIAPVIGVAQAISLNTGITLISDVIGLRGSSGAFVFGIYSFLDKVSCGVVVFVCTESERFKDNDVTFVRWVTVLVPSISCIFAWILVILPNKKEEDAQEDLLSDVDEQSLAGRKRAPSLADELAV